MGKYVAWDLAKFIIVVVIGTVILHLYMGQNAISAASSVALGYVVLWMVYITWTEALFPLVKRRLRSKHSDRLANQDVETMKSYPVDTDDYW